MMWLEVEWDDLDDDVKALLGASDLLRTEEQVARDIILGAIDPVIAFGPRFRFEEREPDDFYISIDVPGPCDQVDFSESFGSSSARCESMSANAGGGSFA